MENRILDKIKSDYNADFKGWDFSYLSDSGRMVESLLPWNYRLIIEKYYEDRKSLLDMGTGGGEFLSSLKNLPEVVSATEGYEPNFNIAKERLKKLGFELKFIKEDNIIPYENEEFDIIINKHEEFKASEVKRCLKEKGVFITQQVGGLNTINLNMVLNAEFPNHIKWSLFSALKFLKDEGFNIIKSQENIGYQRFYDIGAIAYYLKCIPWQIEDFSIEKYQKELIDIHAYIEENGFIDLICHRFLIIAEKNC